MILNMIGTALSLISVIRSQIKPSNNEAVAAADPCVSSAIPSRDFLGNTLKNNGMATDYQLGTPGVQSAIQGLVNQLLTPGESDPVPGEQSSFSGIGYGQLRWLDAAADPHSNKGQAALVHYQQLLGQLGLSQERAPALSDLLRQYSGALEADGAVLNKGAMLSLVA